MREDYQCVFYMSSTNTDGQMENPKACGDCNGYNSYCPYYLTLGDTPTETSYAEDIIAHSNLLRIEHDCDGS